MHTSLAIAALTLSTLLAGCESEPLKAPQPPALRDSAPLREAPTPPSKTDLEANRDASAGRPPGSVDRRPAAPPTDDTIDGADAVARFILERARRDKAEAQAPCDVLNKAGPKCKLDAGEPEPLVWVRGQVEQGPLETITGPGEFEDKVVASELKKRLRAFQVCYEALLRRDPSLRGTVVVDFTLEPAGIMSRSAAAPHSAADPLLTACVVDTVKRFRFNPGPDGGSVSYRKTFTFTPAE